MEKVPPAEGTDEREEGGSPAESGTLSLLQTIASLSRSVDRLQKEMQELRARLHE